jgi:hypothetical protein
MRLIREKRVGVRRRKRRATVGVGARDEEANTCGLAFTRQWSRRSTHVPESMLSVYMSIILSSKSIQYMKGARNHIKTNIWIKQNINLVYNLKIFHWEYISIILHLSINNAKNKDSYGHIVPKNTNSFILRTRSNDEVVSELVGLYLNTIIANYGMHANILLSVYLWCK